MIEQTFLQGLGLDGDTAQALAELIAEETEQEAARRAEKLAAAQREKLPRLVSLTPGSSGAPVDAADYAAMGYAARVQLRETAPELYRMLRRK